MQEYFDHGAAVWQFRAYRGRDNCGNLYAGLLSLVDSCVAGREKTDSQVE